MITDINDLFGTEYSDRLSSIYKLGFDKICPLSAAHGKQVI